LGDLGTLSHALLLFEGLAHAQLVLHLVAALGGVLGLLVVAAVAQPVRRREEAGLAAARPGNSVIGTLILLGVSHRVETGINLALACTCRPILHEVGLLLVMLLRLMRSRLLNLINQSLQNSILIGIGLGAIIVLLAEGLSHVGQLVHGTVLAARLTNHL
jgi:hypothetical protein